MRVRVEIVVFVFLNTVGKELSVDFLDFQILPLFGLACVLVLHVVVCCSRLAEKRRRGKFQDFQSDTKVKSEMAHRGGRWQAKEDGGGGNRQGGGRGGGSRGTPKWKVKGENAGRGDDPQNGAGGGTGGGGGRSRGRGRGRSRKNDVDAALERKKKEDDLLQKKLSEEQRAKEAEIKKQAEEEERKKKEIEDRERKIREEEERKRREEEERELEKKRMEEVRHYPLSFASD